MSALSDMITARQTAGSDYATALEALRTAYIALGGYDLALRNHLVGAPFPQNIATFDGTQEQTVPHGYIHPDFCPRGTVAEAWGAAVAAQAKVNLATLAG